MFNNLKKRKGKQNEKRNRNNTEEENFQPFNR